MKAFAERLLAWFDRHGRHDLPWQSPRSAYRVWVSEIMLQQTRVDTVIPYFKGFVSRFPGVPALAEAPLDEVLHAWSGLGYYARARNLHRAARMLLERHGGQMPAERAALEALPGIGRSTAGAILAQAFDQPEAILDGNVRRVLARHAAVEGWPGDAATQARLWAIAGQRVPASRAADYTQAIMDLGATLCVRSRPRCDACPVVADCRAHAQGRVGELPAARPGRILPLRTRWAGLVDSPEGFFLERRAEAGIWGGLYSFPEAPDASELRDRIHARWPRAAERSGEELRVNHTFTHYRLELRVLQFGLSGVQGGVMEGEGAIWYKPGARARIGLPAPIERFLNEYRRSKHGANG